VVHNDDLAGAEELLRDNQTSESIGYSSSGISDYMGIAFL
jgi:hypothetical protein